MKGQRATVGVIAVFHLPGIFLLFSLGLWARYYIFFPSESDFISLPPSSIHRCLSSKLFSVPFSKANLQLSRNLCNLLKKISGYNEGMPVSIREDIRNRRDMKSRTSLLLTRTTADAIIHDKSVEPCTISKSVIHLFLTASYF